MNNLSDEELIEIYRKREGEWQMAFELILKRYQGPLYSFILRMVKNQTVAEDLFQEVFVSIIKALPSYRAENKLKSWIYRIANNLTIDHLRKTKRRKTSSIEEEIIQKNDRALRVEDILVSPEESPEKIIEKKELKKTLLECLEELTAEQKQVFLLKHQGGLSFKEIANVMKCPLNTALGRMNMAIKKIQKRLVEIL
jgi:RNA polymerase sigma-70 factor, ECF subfamily